MKNVYITITVISSIISLVSTFNGSVPLFFLFLTIMIISIVLTNIEANRMRKNQKGENLSKIDKLLAENNVIKSQFYSNDNQTDTIVLDEEHSQIAIIKKLNETFTLSKLPYSSLVESELKEDGVSITKTSKGAVVGGALLAGGFGAIVGGLVSNKSSQDEIRRITLNLTVDDLSSPIHTIEFMTLNENYIKKDNPYFKERFNQATHWHKLCSVIINRQSNNQVSNH